MAKDLCISGGVKAEDGFTTTVALYVSNFGFLTSLAICVLMQKLARIEVPLFFVGK